MKQQFDADQVEHTVAATPQAVYALLADVTRMPEFTPLVDRIEWLDGATRAALGARFKTRNTIGRGPRWSNKPVITVLRPDEEIAWERTEPLMGTIEWRYRLEPVHGQTRIIESYRMIRPVTAAGWFVIGTLYGVKDNRAMQRRGMEETLRRIQQVVEQAAQISPTPAA